MAYLGHSPTNAGSFIEIDDYGSSFNGSTTAFTLQVGGVDVTPNAQNLLVMIDGVLQMPGNAYSVSGSTITYTEAPASGADSYVVLMGQSASIGQGTIGADELKVSGNGSSGQVLVSDGDGTFSWATDTEDYLPLSGGTLTGDLTVPHKIIHDGDTDTYIRYLSDNIVLYTGGSQRLDVTNSRVYITDSVGIGDSSPSYKLEVKGNIGIQRSTNTEVSEITMEAGQFDIKASPYGYAHRFFNGTGGTSTEKLQITTEGRVIQKNTSLANSCFDIVNGSSSGYGLYVKAGNSTNYALSVNSYDAYNIIDARLNSVDFPRAGTFRIGYGNSSDYGLTIQQNVTSGLVKYSFDVRNNGTDYDNRLVFDRGNVGINDASPTTAKLTVTSDSGSDANALFVYNPNTSASSKVNLNLGLERNASAVKHVAVRLQAGKRQEWTGTPSTVDGYLAFQIVQNETLRERVRMNSGGNTLFNCTSFPSSTVEGFGITGTSSGNASSAGSSTSAYNHFLFYNGNGLRGYIDTTGTTTTYANISDYREKENEVTISDALTRLNQLKPYRFNFIAEPDTTLDGFFAHEVAEVVPEAVTGEKDAVDDEGNIKPQGIDQSKLVPLLVKALQEADNKIDSLIARIEALENA